MKRFFQGSIVAMVTPFRDGAVDRAKIREQVEFHVKHGTDAIVPCGTTGEAPTLSPEEHKEVVEETIKAAAGRVPVIPGTGTNSTAKTIALTKHAKAAGAAAVLIVNPYYNKPTQAGLTAHFRA
ncbi:MAG: dihydrodipicolinate synthase family protein, partial [candidate division NC10 bacterium]|nr:dihydrodipicolinate synthase family protein [candidate division NC10 bacterium]